MANRKQKGPLPAESWEVGVTVYVFPQSHMSFISTEKVREAIVVQTLFKGPLLGFYRGEVSKPVQWELKIRFLLYLLDVEALQLCKNQLQWLTLSNTDLLILKRAKNTTSQSSQL